jgi:hypothetical protein
VAERLLAEASSVLNGHFRTRQEADVVIGDLTRGDGAILWPHYASGPDELLRPF